MPRTRWKPLYLETERSTDGKCVLLKWSLLVTEKICEAHHVSVATGSISFPALGRGGVGSPLTPYRWGMVWPPWHHHPVSKGSRMRLLCHEWGENVLRGALPRVETDNHPTPTNKYKGPSAMGTRSPHDSDVSGRVSLKKRSSGWQLRTGMAIQNTSNIFKMSSLMIQGSTVTIENSISKKLSLMNQLSWHMERENRTFRGVVKKQN